VDVEVRVQDLLAYRGDALIVNLFEGVTKPGGASPFWTRSTMASAVKAVRV